MHAVGLLSVGGCNRKRRRRKAYALRGRVSQNDVTLLRKLTRSGGPRLRCSRSVGGKENVINHLVVFNGRAGQRSNSFFLSFFQVYFSSQQSKQFCHIARGLHKLSPLLQLLVSLFSFFLSFSLSHSPLSLPPVCVLNSLVSCCWLIPRTALHLLRLRLLVVVATVTTFFFFSFFELVVLQSLKRTGSHRSTTGWGAQVKGGGGDGRSSGRARSCDARIFICCRVGVMKCCSSPCWLVSTRLVSTVALWGGTVHGARCWLFVSSTEKEKAVLRGRPIGQDIPSPCTRGPAVWAVSSQAVNNETANLFFSCLFFFGCCRRCWCFQTTDQHVRVQSAHSPAFTRMHSNNKCTPLYNLPPSLPLLLIYLHNQCDAPWFALALACGLRLAMAFFSLFVSSSFFKVGVHFLRYCALVYAVNVYCTVHQYSTNNNNNISGSGEGFIFYDPASCWANDGLVGRSVGVDKTTSASTAAPPRSSSKVCAQMHDTTRCHCNRIIEETHSLTYSLTRSVGRSMAQHVNPL